jgi:glycosyltransferase involved in cell wall biosynthesis
MESAAFSSGSNPIRHLLCHADFGHCTMRVLIVLTYYRPHTSGLTIYAERLAKALTDRGHQVTILTSQYDPSLLREENQDGVHIIRIPVLLRISKGVIMPSFGFRATQLVKQHDVIQLHLPQFDAAGVALRGRLLKKPTVITYHCDLLMPAGLLSQSAMWAVRLMNNLAAIFTHRIVTYTRDYAEHSPYLKKYLKKVKIIPPPVEMPVVDGEKVKEFRMKYNGGSGSPVIGMAARFASEKGVETLLDAMPKILKEYPRALVLFAGAYQNIIGEEEYARRLMPVIRQYEEAGNWKFLGNLNPELMAAFYSNLDILVVPSLNSTESFGLVQIEAMMHGVPAVASDLPGVRQPVLVHHMGRIAPIGDSAGMANGILDVITHKNEHITNAETIRERYLPDSIAKHYEALFEEIHKDLK